MTSIAGNITFCAKKSNCANDSLELLKLEWLHKNALYMVAPNQKKPQGRNFHQNIAAES